jgi:hypothetical protein
MHQKHGWTEQLLLTLVPRTASRVSKSSRGLPTGQVGHPPTSAHRTGMGEGSGMWRGCGWLVEQLFHWMGACATGWGWLRGLGVRLGEGGFSGRGKLLHAHCSRLLVQLLR